MISKWRKLQVLKYYLLNYICCRYSHCTIFSSPSHSSFMFLLSFRAYPLFFKFLYVGTQVPSVYLKRYQSAVPTYLCFYRRLMMRHDQKTTQKHLKKPFKYFFKVITKIIDYIYERIGRIPPNQNHFRRHCFSTELGISRIAYFGDWISLRPYIVPILPVPFIIRQPQPSFYQREDNAFNDPYANAMACCKSALKFSRYGMGIFITTYFLFPSMFQTKYVPFRKGR